MYKIVGIIFAVIFLSGWSTWWWSQLHLISQVHIIDDGKELIVKNVHPGMVADVFAQANITVAPDDHITPQRQHKLAEGMQIVIARHKNVHITKNNQEMTREVFGRVSLAEALRTQGITYDDDDIITPSRETIITDGMHVRIIDVGEKEEQEVRAEPFKKITKKDPQKNLGEKTVTQKGVKGKKTITYRVVLHDGKEYSRHVLKEEITTAPIDEITTIGTKKKPPVVKLGKSHKGRASWYGNKGCDCAANPWLPFGTQVKVTNRANGKSVIVTINDRGPFIKGRIIDLDKVAWKKIAPLGAGVIDVTMQEIKQ